MLFTPLSNAHLPLGNRVVMAPMVQKLWDPWIPFARARCTPMRKACNPIPHHAP